METQAQMDFLAHGGLLQGNVAKMMAANGTLDPGVMRPWIDEKTGLTYCDIYIGGPLHEHKSYVTQQIGTNGVLRREEWMKLDEVVLKLSETRLGGVQDLISRGLTVPLGNAMGTTVYEYEDLSDAFEAVLSMDGIDRGKGDRQVYGSNYIPLPIIHVDYEIKARVLAASRNRGAPLDTTSAEAATRKVLQKREDMLFTNTTYAFGGGTIFSYVNHGSRNQQVMVEKWDASGKTGKEILDEVLAMKQLSIAAMHYGPWMLYIPTDYETKLDEDYSAAKGSNTIRERILKIEGIEGIKVIDTLADDQVLLVQMTSDVVRLITGLPVQSVQWGAEGNFISKHKVLTIQVPQVRADQDGNSGVVHLAPAA